MSNTVFASRLIVAIMALSLIAPSAFASHIDWDAWRAEREAARQVRDAERAAEKAAQDQPQCTCSASLSYDRPTLQFTSAGLLVTPRVNVSVRLRGDQDGPKHTIGVTYEGSSSYTSDDVTVPAGTSFSGTKTLLTDASCEGHWNFDGIELDRVTLSGITRTLLGAKQELEGTVKLKAAIAGCGFQEENRQFSFTAKEFGNLKVGTWRSVR